MKNMKLNQTFKVFLILILLHDFHKHLLLNEFSFFLKSLTIFESLTVDDALQKLQNEDVPCSKTISLDELMTHPQIEANNLFQLINSASQGKVRALRYPTKFDGNEMFNGKPAPALGEHKKEIIESLSN